MLRQELQQLQSRKIEVVIFATHYQIDVFSFASHRLSSLIPSRL